jgi:hypothetical protein
MRKLSCPTNMSSTGKAMLGDTGGAPHFGAAYWIDFSLPKG